MEGFHMGKLPVWKAFKNLSATYNFSMVHIVISVLYVKKIAASGRRIGLTNWYFI